MVNIEFIPNRSEVFRHTGSHCFCEGNVIVDKIVIPVKVEYIRRNGNTEDRFILKSKIKMTKHPDYKEIRKQILQVIRSKYEKFHMWSYCESAIRATDRRIKKV